MSQEVAYWHAVNAFYHSYGDEHAAARGALLEFALRGKGRVKRLARELLATKGIIIARGA